MTPFRARLGLFAVMAIFLATAGNALFLQDRSRLLPANGLPHTDVSITKFPSDNPSPSPPRTRAPAAPSPTPAASDLPPEARLHAALRRELGRRGYANQLQDNADGLRLAVLAYEFDNGLPLTGSPTDELLKRVLFDVNQAPRGVFADRAEVNAKLVRETQKNLLELGFFSGTLSGRMDDWTVNAIKTFERYRHIAITGRLTEATLLQLITYSGQGLLTPSASNG
jgi:hypothetical protein